MRIRHLPGLILAAGLAGLSPAHAQLSPPTAEAAITADRALPAGRNGRYALIIGLANYQQDARRPVPSLQGTPLDMISARQMAHSLQVPDANIVELRDQQASRDGVTQALAQLAEKVQSGDRVFIYWSGHGSRFFDPRQQGCVETLIPWDLKDFTYAEFARLIKPIGDRTDKLMVLYDACHSGGVKQSVVSRALTTVSGDGLDVLQPKLSGVSEQCSLPSNVARQRGFEPAAASAGMGLGDVVHIASSRPDEVSFDNPRIGGLATAGVRECLLGDARDLDGSGAITADEIVQCAQAKIDHALRAAVGITPQHITLSGNRGFVPAYFATAPVATPVATSVTAPVTAPAVTAPVVAPAAPGSTALTPTPAAPSTPAQILAEIHGQRDHKRMLRVTSSNTRLTIGRDALDLMVQSERSGYLYIAMAGSDGNSLALLYPNVLDRNNRIQAGEQLLLPHPSWRVAAGGPPGTDRLLVMVTDGPRDLRSLKGPLAGPFVLPLLDPAGRSRLQTLLAQTVCAPGARCSDAFASALLDLEEIK